MSSPPALPGPQAVARLLHDLLGKAVTPKKGSVLLPSGKVCVGTYVDDAGKPVGACVCDLPLAASMGAALALSPASVAADAVRKGQLPGELFDNLHEVLNVVANLFGGIHVRLQQVLPPSAALPASVAALVNRSSARLDLELAIAGYPGGRMSLVC